jgi:aspartyl-tRNA(Asn)/glutamyl-tRNA(Gln) amidotransferase subunit B
VSDLAGLYAKNGAESFDTLEPAAFARLVRMVAAGDLSSRGAKDTLATLVERGGDPEAIARERGLLQMSDRTALLPVVDAVLAREERAVQEYRAGKDSVLQYLLGMAMKETRGAGNPEALRELLTERLAVQ